MIPVKGIEKRVIKQTNLNLSFFLYINFIFYLLLTEVREYLLRIFYRDDRICSDLPRSFLFTRLPDQMSVVKKPPENLGCINFELTLILKLKMKLEMKVFEVCDLKTKRIITGFSSLST